MDMSKFQSEIAAMTPDQVRAELAKAKDLQAKHMAKQKEYNSKPENQEKRKAYSKEYNSRPDVQAKRTEHRKAYMARPEVKEKQKAYRNARNERTKLLIAAAQQQGIDVKEFGFKTPQA